MQAQEPILLISERLDMLSIKHTHTHTRARGVATKCPVFFASFFCYVWNLSFVWGQQTANSPRILHLNPD
jgi:hypothetical protein